MTTINKLKAFICKRIRRLLGVDWIHDYQRDLLDQQHFLQSVSSVIHVGANSGYERELYDRFGLKVLWIEPLPKVFEQLKENLAEFRRQHAIQALVTDIDGQKYDFHVASNNGASSSIFELNEHKEIWPDVEFVETISLESKTLASLLNEQGFDPSDFEALIMDTQGSELLVLKGAESMLKHFRFIKTEVADFDSYSGSCTVDDIDDFMRSHKFRRFSCQRFARRKGGGAYYDITYRNIG
ncbi:MAG: FkbM family methyltransferase [Verrucomicrobiota bacterium]